MVKLSAHQRLLRFFYGNQLTAPLFKRATNTLECYRKLSENWNNCDPETNGEHWLLSLISQDAEVVLDVGANRGDWTSSLLNLGYSGNVWAFEASPQTASFLERRFAKYPKVSVETLALGAMNCELIFNDYGPHSPLSGFASRELTIGVKPLESYSVPCWSLDTVWSPDRLSIDFLKIDTEGSEFAILRGATKLLENKRIACLQFEYGGTWIDSRTWLTEAIEFLWSFGYVVGRLLPNRVDWIEAPRCLQLECFQYSNFVACKDRREAHRLK